MISDYFTNFDFKSLLPDWVDLFGGSKTSGDGKQMQSPQVTPEARLSGRMNISVTASGGASAAVSDVSGLRAGYLRSGRPIGSLCRS